ncbi:MAG: hypothetical protein PHI77_01430 [Candidatus Pacebacteria bacterium]|nr:hypothetical protein [Candidatus Paceibacterota bacterium]
MAIFSRIKPKTKAEPENSLTWYFPSTDHCSVDGFADSQLEYFQGNHEKYIAREAIQNAVDARSNSERPVIIIFEKFDLLVSQIPGWQMLLDRCKRCLDFDKGQEKSEIFFRNAIELLKSETVSVLKISDYNTIGLSGQDDDRSGGWYRLVRADGVSSPKGVSGGSFGIGKGAPIAASQLRTVFYSSINDKNEPVFQGKARLVSHYGEDDDVKRGIGFYGIDGYRSIRDAKLIPDIFERKERGTDIFIIGYDAGEKWKEKLIESVMENSWLAIYDGDLEVIIRDGDEKIINKNNLKDYFSNYETGESAFFYEARTNWTQKFEKELKHLGSVALFVKKHDCYPGEVMMVRKPKMLVETKAYRALREPYAGVFICDNDKGNFMLRDLEIPTHDKWDRDRAKNGWAAMGELDLFIKESLKSMGQTSSNEPQDIPGLDRYLPDSDDRDYLSESEEMPTQPTESAENEESGREIGAVKEPTSEEVEGILRKVNVKSPSIGSGSLPGGGESNKTTGGDNEGTGSGDEEGDRQGKRIRTADVSFRSFVQKTKHGIEYHFAILGREECDGSIRIVAVGDDGNYSVDLANAKDVDSQKELEISGAFIKGLSIRKGKTVRLSVSLKSRKKYSLAIENYEG